MLFFYKKILRPLLFRLSPDTAHSFASFSLKVFGSMSVFRWVMSLFLSYEHPSLHTEVSGILFPNPIGLPAGFDPNASQAFVYRSLGFGFATVGSVSFHSQPGNPRPHNYRLVKDESLIVHKGLKNKGAIYVAKRIEQFRSKNKIDYPLGISIARTTDIPNEKTVEDYVSSFQILAPQADYIEVNVSCPNIACFSSEEQIFYIDSILKKINLMRKQKKYDVPVWLKIGPDLSDKWNEKIIDICLKRKVDAVVLTNLIKDRSKLTILSSGWEKIPGGISGKLLAPFSEEKLDFFYKRLNGKIPLVSVGGVFSAEDAYRRIRHGASLIQVLTGWIYEGPSSIKIINKMLLKMLKKDGFENVSDAVGCDVSDLSFTPEN